MRKLFVYIPFLLLFIGCDAGNPYSRGAGWMHHDWTTMINYGWGGIIMWLLLLVVIIIGIYIFMRGQGSNGDMFSSRETPLDILKKRYARGEITKEEYDRMKDDLS